MLARAPGRRPRANSMRRLSIGLILVAAALAACHPSPSRGGSGTRAAAANGSPSSSCLHGWSTPGTTAPEIREALTVIRTTLRISSALQVVTDRFFTGPESPNGDDKGYLQVVDRFYVKAREKKDPSLGGRFLVERRQFGIGLVAAAPFDTSGYDSHDWTGFQYQAGSQPQRVKDIPGTVQAVTYDFVDGGQGLDFPGLPADVAGCMDGT